MSLYREVDRKALAVRHSGPPRGIYVIEESAALGMLLQSRVEEEARTAVRWLKSHADAMAALDEQLPALAISGLDLADAANGGMLDHLAQLGVPTILFTASLDRSMQKRFGSPNIIDYFVKDTGETIDQIVNTIMRFTDRISVSVLIVDDMTSSRMMLIDLLQQQNYRIFQAASGREALDILEANSSIELVVTDHHMGDMDGHSLTRHIRARYAPDRLRVIGISASSDPYLSASFLKAGASDFIYRPFIAEEVRYRIASNIETLAQLKHLRFLAERDPLTGLFNRRAFFERAQDVVDSLKDSGAEGSVAILDIDHFKKVNDSYGHDTGDKVIQMVAKVLHDLADGPGVMSARFGGEEFVILFSAMPSEVVRARCEEIRLAIAAMAVPYEDSVINVTASIGAAIFQSGEGMDNNLNAADQMLYMAKAKGRDRLVYDADFYAA